MYETLQYLYNRHLYIIKLFRINLTINIKVKQSKVDQLHQFIFFNIK